MKYLRLFAFGLFAGVALLYTLERWSSSVDQAEIRSLEVWGKNARRRADTLTVRLAGHTRTFTRWLTTWDTIIRVDTLQGDTVWVPVTVLQTADSTIRSCSIALTTCQELAALERERADSAERLAQLWRRQARGPFLRIEGELLVSGTRPRGAATLEAGRRLSAVARLEVDTLPRFWAGLRYQF